MLTIDQMILEANLRIRFSILKSSLDAKQQLGLLGDESVDDYLELQATEHFLDDVVDRHWNENYERAELRWRETHSWLDDVERSVQIPTPTERAVHFVCAYISASRDCEFGYDCNVNPEGLSDDLLSELEDDARNRMMAALSVLADARLSDLLASHMDRDHDGSQFAVTSIGAVRRWQEIQNERGNMITVSTQSKKEKRPPQERWPLL